MGPFDRGEFENNWQKRFRYATVEPSPGLWEEIDHELTYSENKKLKGALFWTRSAAAAAVVLAVAVVAYNFYNTDSVQAENELAMDNSSEISESSKESSGPAIADSKSGSRDTETVDKAIQPEKQVYNSDENRNIVSDTESEMSTVNTNKVRSSESNTFNNNALNNKVISEQKQLTLASANSLGLSEMTTGPYPEIEGRYVWKMDFSEEKFKQTTWAGLTFAGGSVSDFNGVASYDMAETNSADFNNSDGSNQYSSESINGNAQVFGLTFGKQFTKQFSLVSGLQYANIVSGAYYGSDPTIQTSSIDRAKTSFESYNSSDPGILIENNYDYLTIPLKAGFSVIDKKIGLNLLSGVDTRFLVNSHTREYSYGTFNSEIPETKANKVNLWGSVNAELNYRVNKNYTISLSPGYKISLNSIEENSNDLHGLAELGFGFRYNFNQ